MGRAGGHGSRLRPAPALPVTAPEPVVLTELYEVSDQNSPSLSQVIRYCHMLDSLEKSAFSLWTLMSSPENSDVGSDHLHSPSSQMVLRLPRSSVNKCPEAAGILKPRIQSFHNIPRLTFLPIWSTHSQDSLPRGTWVLGRKCIFSGSLLKTSKHH